MYCVRGSGATSYSQLYPEVAATGVSRLADVLNELSRAVRRPLELVAMSVAGGFGCLLIDPSAHSAPRYSLIGKDQHPEDRLCTLRKADW